MKGAIARAAMILAARCLGDRRREWAVAMQAEFDSAAEAGEELSFAVGCLLGAWRQMPVEHEGRFALATYLLAIGVILPSAALLLSSVAQGFPYFVPESSGAIRALGSGDPAFVNRANQMALPLMATLTLLLGLGHLGLAWAMLDRDWARVAALARLGASAATTMVTFSSMVFLYDSCALPGAALIAIELSAIWFLVRWSAELEACDAAPPPQLR